ncbi:MAG: lysophospholipid acyltransferase family protein [Desulfobacterales bacterium]
MKLNLSAFLQWRFNIFMCRMIGWRITFFYIRMLGTLYFLFNPKEKWKIRKAVKTVFSDHKYRPEIRSISKKVFRGTFSHYFEKFFNAYSTAGTLRNFVMNHMESEGLEAIKHGLAKGKGILLITGHFGGVEFIPAFLGANNFPVSIVAKFKSKDLRNASVQQASNFLTKIIDPEQTPNIIRAIFDDLKANRIVITQCDEIDEWKPSRYDKLFFLGKQVCLDKTVNILSKRCAATVVFGVMHRDDNHRYKFIATSYEEIAKQYQRSINMPMGAMLLKFMEHYIYKYPEEWYQWKKYQGLDVFAPSGADVKIPASVPVLKPSLI